MNVEDKFISVMGCRIHYLAAGEAGSPVILLHGGGLDSARLSWGQIIGPLAEAGHRVYAPDCPGYGDSDRPGPAEGPCGAADTIEEYAGCLREFMDGLGLARAGLLGISMGGGIALAAALLWPERVDRLVLVDSYGLQRTVQYHKLSYLTVHIPGLMAASYALAGRSRSLARASLGTILHDASKAPDSLIDELLREARKPHAGRPFSRMQRREMTWSGLRTVYIDRLKEIRAPILFIHGDEDKLVPLHWAEEAHARVPGSQLHVIKGAGHWPHPEHPEELVRVAAEFLK